ncbi:septum formation inhibitor Maf [Campylobacter showae]|uniref:septum formation inhibitor Maf n=1 Tax=Campylobacter showae TaxID=204 RepID=UPI003C70332C
MIILASSSATRAKVLRDHGVKFEQVFFDYDESGVDKNLPPHVYVQKIVAAKKEQFLKANENVKKVVFADSVVVCGGKILGKAKDKQEALKMLQMQSGSTARIVTAMIFLGEKFELFNVSFAEYKFAKFDEADLQNYLSGDLWQGKAGAMTIENFNKKYILSQNGETSTAMGLNVKILKAFL